jgi:hypothetical protein
MGMTSDIGSDDCDVVVDDDDVTKSDVHSNDGYDDSYDE